MLKPHSVAEQLTAYAFQATKYPQRSQDIDDQLETASRNRRTVESQTPKSTIEMDEPSGKST